MLRATRYVRYGKEIARYDFPREDGRKMDLSSGLHIEVHQISVLTSYNIRIRVRVPRMFPIYILLRVCVRIFCVFVCLRIDASGVPNEHVEKMCTQARDHACRCMLAL